MHFRSAVFFFNWKKPIAEPISGYFSNGMCVCVPVVLMCQPAYDQFNSSPIMMKIWDGIVSVITTSKIFTRQHESLMIIIIICFSNLRLNPPCTVDTVDSIWAERLWFEKVVVQMHCRVRTLIDTIQYNIYRGTKIRLNF